MDTPFRSEALIAASRGLEAALNEFGRQADHLDAILGQAERDRDALADLRAELTAAQVNRDAAQGRVRELEAELHRERTAAQQAAYDAEQAIAALRADLAATRAVLGGA